ncbi:MAG: metallophosphoesterase [Deltaproteobacteria bacterium]|nr:metallophosphoesterase [Deltaproteobacteria bacterium]
MKDKYKPPRRLLHTSDLHLQSFNDGACRDFEAFLVAAGQTKPDLIVIAGDLFDHHRIGNDLIAYVAESLKRLVVPAIILPGNHDCLEPTSPYRQSRFWDNCSNIHIFREPDGEIIRLDDLAITLWGKPITSYSEDIAPLGGIPHRKGNGDWHIAVAHGLYAGDEGNVSRSYLITREDIMCSGWDYVALGHMNLFKCICSAPVKAYYSGSPAISGGVAIVDLIDDTKIDVRQYVFDVNSRIAAETT